jgi:WD40-like Beta Propeller Repeat
VLLWRGGQDRSLSWDWTKYAWTAAMAVAAVLSVRSTFRLQTAVRQEYAYRLPLQADAFLHANPRYAGTELRYIGFVRNGYHLMTADEGGVWIDPSAEDDLSFTDGAGHLWVERASAPRSKVVDVREPSRVVLDDAREPMISTDEQSLAFVRDDHGRGRLMVRRAFQSDAASEVAITPSPLNIYEASFRSEREYAFSAADGGRAPQIYLTDAAHSNAPLSLGESRYPALSPDGRWLAYSRLERGMWNLWVRDERTGATRRVADVPCNQIQPAWEDDSKTLLYSTDCGRSLWLTAVAQRRVIP